MTIDKSSYPQVPFFAFARLIRTYRRIPRLKGSLPRLWCVLVPMAVISSGCIDRAEKDSSTQFSKVAKDWSEMIRACQIVPVYPPIEELVPGQMFLVQTPIELQQQLYQQKGFLPLDSRIARLPITEPTAGWPRAVYDKTALDDETWWSNLPLVAFPSYSFDVSRDAGASIAVPLNVVGLGLDALGTSHATASVTIKDSRTYGVDLIDLLPAMQEWARNNRAYLRAFAPRCPKGNTSASHCVINYLRVVNRVFLARSMEVTTGVSAEDKVDAKASVGLSTPDAKKKLQDTLDAAAINTKVLNSAGPLKKALGDLDNTVHSVKAGQTTLPISAVSGPISQVQGLLSKLSVGSGNVSYSSVTSRSVSLTQTFEHPLAIGYLGFDFPILADGALGVPTTLAVLGPATAATDQPRVLEVPAATETYKGLLNTIGQRPDADRIFSKAIVLLAPTTAHPIEADWSTPERRKRRMISSDESRGVFVEVVAPDSDPTHALAALRQSMSALSQ